MSAQAFVVSKDTDSVLVRLPSTLKTQAVTVAEHEKVSANALYAAGVLFATIIYGPMPRIGRPQNLQAFIEEIDQAVAEDLPIVGALHQDDLSDVSWLLNHLTSVSWVKDVRVRTDVKAASTMVYTFALSKVGRAMWPEFSRMLRAHFGFVPTTQEGATSAKNASKADVA